MVTLTKKEEAKEEQVGGGSPANKNRKKTVYYFYVGSSKLASDYDTISEYIINYIKKTFYRGNYVAKALQTLVKTDPDTWKPTLKASKETNQENKNQEN